MIASVNGEHCLLECLEKLEAQTARDQMEVLVLDRRTDGTAEAVARRFPWVKLRAGMTGKSIPELRWEGMRAAQGDWIAVIEDHCMAPPDWAAGILEFTGSPYGVVGGPVENGARERLLDWAFFLAEYGPCMPPLPEGETEGVPGNNAAYRREVLPLSQDGWAHVWESFLQNDLRQKGVRIFLSRALLIYHKKSFTLGEMLEQAKGADFDNKWLGMMIKHHQGAVEMTKTEQAKGQFPEAKTMAGNIITSQTAEITTLEAILPPHDDLIGQWSTQEGLQRTQAAREMLRQAGIAQHLHLTVGDPARELRTLAAQTAADLVALGTRGLGAAHHALIGSVALKVAVLCELPVMLVP